MKSAYDMAQSHLGLKEIPGPKHEPKIVAMFAEVGHDWVGDDETAWCAAFVGAMLKRTGYPHTGKLIARSYLEWGEKVEPKDAREGDLMIFKRGTSAWQGHVGFWTGKSTTTHYVILGGNQGNMVSEARYAKKDLLGVRRMKPKTPTKPVRPAWLQAIIDFFKGK